ncbi:hypothetical protein DMB38_32075 [Streptomyces sp. WAC 06738]|uniref:hypothetical protein n=1 Tax=Streptomyces sp. WAC 06738 TaxID=2203210 RepID=UPI000F6B6473|nr:hypothetical protein [Streptomyces sp. WAC 06738]AZM49802.1 hypothetical protein DMB38_32075 [Streptomyces sp. WAC 06738]
MDWYPGGDETLQYRTGVHFAAGVAPRVAGARWFRDTGRRDIQRELQEQAGWPEGPEFTVRPAGERAARRTGRVLGVGIPAVLNVVANALGGGGSPFGSPSVRGRPDEPENEVDDFPVLWADPGTVARGAPWQLDPSRRPDTYRTHVALTERRLVFLGTTVGSIDPADVLWEVPRDTVAELRRMPYSEGESDVRLTFTDSSWIRLTAMNPDDAALLIRHLQGAVGSLQKSDLTEGQRIRVDRFVRDLPKNAEPPTFTVLPSGIVQVCCEVPAKGAPGLYDTHAILMDSAGAPAQPRPGDL